MLLSLKATYFNIRCQNRTSRTAIRRIEEILSFASANWKDINRIKVFEYKTSLKTNCELHSMIYIESDQRETYYTTRMIFHLHMRRHVMKHSMIISWLQIKRKAPQRELNIVFKELSPPRQMINQAAKNNLTQAHCVENLNSDQTSETKCFCFQCNCFTFW